MKKIILIFFLSLLSPKITSAQIIILKNCYTIGHTPEQTEFYKKVKLKKDNITLNFQCQ